MVEHKHHKRGFLSFLIMWMLRNRKMNGSEITDEMEKERIGDLALARYIPF